MEAFLMQLDGGSNFPVTTLGNKFGVQTIFVGAMTAPTRRKSFIWINPSNRLFFKQGQERN